MANYVIISYLWVFFPQKKLVYLGYLFIILIRGDLFVMKFSYNFRSYGQLLSFFKKLFFMNSWCFKFCNGVEKSYLCLFKKGLFCSRKTGSKCRSSNYSFSIIYDDRIFSCKFWSQFLVFVYSYSVVYNKLLIQDCEIMDFCDNKCINVISVYIIQYNIQYNIHII